MERAKAWERVARKKAHVGEAGFGYEEKAIIDEIANHFPDNDREFQLQRAKAQSDVCGAMLSHKNGVSEAAAEAVEKIVSTFPQNDRDLQYTLLRVRTVLFNMKADQGDPSLEADQRRVEDVVRRFADDFEFCEILAGVRRRVCSWKARRRDPGCMAEAKSVAMLVNEFPGLPSIRLEYVTARVACCIWMANRGDAACELEAGEIDRIVGGVENNRGEAFQFERAQAWRAVCIFWSGRINKVADKARCKRAADIVFEIARQFPRNPEMTEDAQLCREALGWFDARSSN